jgi:hypothetical protein
MEQKEKNGCKSKIKIEYKVISTKLGSFSNQLNYLLSYSVLYVFCNLYPALLHFLHIHQPLIKPILQHQAVVCTTFYYFTFLQYNDLISVTNGT